MKSIDSKYRKRLTVYLTAGIFFTGLFFIINKNLRSDRIGVVPKGTMNNHITQNPYKDSQSVKNNIDNESGALTIKGTITSMNLGPLMSNEAGIATLEIRSASDGKFTIAIGPGEYADGKTLCDRFAIKIPQGLTENKDIEARGIPTAHPDGSKMLSICLAGSYVKLLQ